MCQSRDPHAIGPRRRGRPSAGRFLPSALAGGIHRRTTSSSRLPAGFCPRRLPQIFALLCVLVLAARSNAHDISVSRGTLVVQRDALQAELTIPAADLLHYCRPARCETLSAKEVDSLIERYSHHVLANFVIRDAAGERIAPRLTVNGHDLAQADAWPWDVVRKASVKYRIAYAIAPPPSFLTLQQTFFRDGPSHAAQLSLFVAASPDGPGRTIQLTNRGNVETLEIKWPDREDARPQVRIADEFKSVSARLSIEDSQATLDIHMPLTLLETFLPIDRADRNFLTPAEQSAAAARLQDFFAGRNALHADGKRIAPRVAALRMLAPDENELVDAPPRRLGAWSARMGVRLCYPLDAAPQTLELHWDLFNSAVLEATVCLAAGAEFRTERLSSYAPMLRWPRRPMPAARPATPRSESR